MRRFWSGLSLFVVCLAVGMACGDSDGGDDNGGGGGDNNATHAIGPPVSLGDFSDSYTQVICGRAFGCCDAEEREELFEEGFDADSEEECRESLEEGAEEEFGTSIEAAEDGRMAYDAEKAGNCLAALEELDCSAGVSGSSAEAPDDCLEIFEGETDEGQSCDSSAECRQGVCHEENGTSVCRGAGEVGDPCQWTDDCVEGAYCTDEEDPETGLPLRVCKPLGEQGDSCSSEIDCEDELYCNSELDSESGETVGTCKEKVGIGQDCDLDGCNEQGYCELEWDDQLAEEVGTCKEKKPVGESCDQFDQCSQDAYCPATEQDASCEALKADGDDCESSQECQSGLCDAESDDEGAPKTCRPYNQDGGEICSGG